MHVIPSAASQRSGFLTSRFLIATRLVDRCASLFSHQSLSQAHRSPGHRYIHFRVSQRSMGAPKPGEQPQITGKRTGAGTATMAPSKFEVRGYTEHKAPKPPSPSASVIVVSPTNEILLLHRVQTSSAFPSAHVFPGGNLEASDGDLPADSNDINRHLDSIAYRTGAIRELFEESGILLARESKDAKALLAVSRDQRQNGREAVHDGKITLSAWIKSISPDAVLDTDRLIPFTHWVTPPNVPKRFSTQMYIYFVELEEAGNPSVRATPDRVETMAPEWRRARDWLNGARSGEIILFPPQFLLLYLTSEILDRGVVNGQDEARDEVLRKREQLRHRIEKEGSPAWKDKFISPMGLQFGREDGRSVLALDKPGPELKGSGLKGDSEYVVLVKFRKEGPRQLEIALRKDVLRDERDLKAQKEQKL
ncbi:hypothetical protein PV11_04814 [Exophiala sideris]|uniref:Nudix hydrolase domain-containing protein n=1 Tax=Exophiala sideris TaxID=1016849 RepID=A0A0D1Z7A1_9EURO|nr:hypothetical protein PV11_04814 [Exophiala sideris]